MAKNTWIMQVDVYKGRRVWGSNKTFCPKCGYVVNDGGGCRTPAPYCPQCGKHNGEKITVVENVIPDHPTPLELLTARVEKLEAMMGIGVGEEDSHAED